MTEHKKDIKEDKMEDKKEVKVAETSEKKQEVKEDKKAKVKIVKKDEAVANGWGLHMSPKQAAYICSFVKNKKVDDAIKDLGLVIKMKKAVPFKGEIPHRKGMMSGRYPVRASDAFITVLKGLRGNIIVNGMELENTKIYYASASPASKPYKSGGRRAKRTNLVLKAREIKNG